MKRMLSVAVVILTLGASSMSAAAQDVAPDLRGQLFTQEALCLSHPGTLGIRHPVPGSGPSENGRHVNADPARTSYWLGVFEVGELHLVPEPEPEPATLLLLGAGLVGLRAWRRRGQ